MNYHNDKWIVEKVKEHYQDALLLYPKDRIVGIFVQGSTNYGLDYEGSDLDTKLIVAPNFKDICLNKKPVSTTHVRFNEEHIDAKDIRLYIETFRKQNLNFLEILFTDFYFLNHLYEKQWNRLVDAREQIARMNETRAVKSMKGIAMEKYHAMKRPYPSKIDIIEKFGYDGKQTHHLLRVEDYLERYINGESYLNCMRPTADIVEHLMAYKRQEIPLAQAEKEAEAAINHVTEMCEKFCCNRKENENVEMKNLLEDVSYNIMKISITRELERE